MQRLEGKTAVITGASSGIGRAIARSFAREGADLVINCNRSVDKAETLKSELEKTGRRITVIQADISDPDDARRLVRQSLEFLQRIDILVNNAGADILTSEGAKLDDHEKLARLIDVDMKGTMHLCWETAPLMQQQGHGVILNMSWDQSVYGFHGKNPQMFSAVKAGIMGFSKSLARTFAPEVRVNILAPGWIETGFAAEAMPRDYYQARVNEIPLRRFGTPEDVAAAALFLASDEAAYLTGQVMNINGGIV
ncbi:MAG: SDR family NAD(P)-dependent oxidoreductase [Gammaproteobacteria bacterium]